MTATQMTLDALRAAQASAGHAWASAWAAWVVGGVGILVNIVGLALIRQQLKAGQEAVRQSAISTKAASDAAAAATATSRPWLKASFVDQATYKAASAVPGEEHPGMLAITVEWENVGQTPASDICCFAQLLPRATATAANDALQRILQQESFASSSLFPGESDLTERRLEVGAEVPNKAWPVILVVRYRTPGTDNVHHTGEVVGIMPELRQWNAARVRLDRSIRIDPT